MEPIVSTDVGESTESFQGNEGEMSGRIFPATCQDLNVERDFLDEGSSQIEQEIRKNFYERSFAPSDVSVSQHSQNLFEEKTSSLSPVINIFEAAVLEEREKGSDVLFLAHHSEEFLPERNNFIAQTSAVESFQEKVFEYLLPSQAGISYNRLDQQHASLFLNSVVKLMHQNAQTIIFDCDDSFPKDLSLVLWAHGPSTKVIFIHESSLTIHGIETCNIDGLMVGVKKKGFISDSNIDNNALTILDSGIQANDYNLKELRLIAPFLMVDASLEAEKIYCVAGAKIEKIGDFLNHFQRKEIILVPHQSLSYSELMLGAKAELRAEKTLTVVNTATHATINSIKAIASDQSPQDEEKRARPILMAPIVHLAASAQIEYHGCIQLFFMLRSKKAA